MLYQLNKKCVSKSNAGRCSTFAALRNSFCLVIKVHSHNCVQLQYLVNILTCCFMTVLGAISWAGHHPGVPKLQGPNGGRPVQSKAQRHRLVRQLFDHIFALVFCFAIICGSNLNHDGFDISCLNIISVLNTCLMWMVVNM